MALFFLLWGEMPFPLYPRCFTGHAVFGTQPYLSPGPKLPQSPLNQGKGAILWRARVTDKASHALSWSLLYLCEVNTLGTPCVSGTALRLMSLLLS